jgi:hypothetical protein
MAMLENAQAFNKALKSFVESLPDMDTIKKS